MPDLQFSVRPAERTDFGPVTAIYSEAVENGVATYELIPPDRVEMERRFEMIAGQGYPYIVAEEGGRIVGYAYASAFRDRPAYRWLVEDSIYLAPESRGRGAGRLLLDALLAQCEARGFRQMVAVIGGAEAASIGVHRAAGFAMIGIMPGTGFKLGRWLDTVLMQKALGEGNATPPAPASCPHTPIDEC